MRLSTFIVGAATGYVFGTKAGRKRYHQIRRAYEFAVNSPISKAAVTTTRKALAAKLDPEPRMKELKLRKVDSNSPDILVPDED